MSNIVTFEQAKRLCGLGFNKPCWRTYIFTSEKLIPKGNDGKMNKNSELCKGYYSAPTISQALDYLREEKGIICSVGFDYHDGYFYYGVYTIDEWLNYERTDPFDTHPLAESALLTAVLDYLEKKGG